MSKLSDFLSKNNVKDIVEEVELTGRLAGMKFKIKSMTSSEYDNYCKACQKIIGIGKEIKIDQTKLRMLILKNHVVDPDFSSSEFLTTCGCNTPEQFIEERLLIGEQIALQGAISELSGFNTDINKEIEEAKN